MFKWNFLFSNLCPLPLVLSLHTTKKCLAPSSLLPLTCTLIYVYKSSLGLTIPALSAFPWITDAPIRLSSLWLSVDLYQYTHVSPVLGSLGLDTALQRCLTRAEQRGRIVSLDLTATLFLMQLRMPLAFFASRKPHSQLPHGHFAACQEPRGIFLTNWFPSCQLQACTGPWDHSFPSAFDFDTLFQLPPPPS